MDYRIWWLIESDPKLLPEAGWLTSKHDIEIKAKINVFRLKKQQEDTKFCKSITRYLLRAMQ